MPGKYRISLPLAYMIGIFILSSIPGTSETGEAAELQTIFQWISPDLQNLLHAPLFGGLAACWYWALQGWTAGFCTTVATSLVISTLYSVFDEVYQLSVPGRFGSLSDLCLNILGVAVMLSGLILYHRKSASCQLNQN